MKRIIISLILITSVFTLKAQYHLKYFSNDTIPKMLEDADFLFRQKKYDESSAIYWKLSKIDSLKAISIYKIANNDIFSAKYDLAFTHLKLSMLNGYDSLTVFMDMVYIYNRKLNDPQKAFDLLTEMIGYWPNNAVLYRERAIYHLKLRRDIEGSTKDLQKAAELGDNEAIESLKFIK
jgi:tetratricopeptide (TPR) repeat protein